MNAARRKEITKARGLLNEARVILEEAARDEAGAVEALPESLQDSDNAQRMSEVAEQLAEIADVLDDIDGQLEDASA